MNPIDTMEVNPYALCFQYFHVLHKIAKEFMKSMVMAFGVNVPVHRVVGPVRFESLNQEKMFS